MRCRSWGNCWLPCDVSFCGDVAGACWQRFERWVRCCWEAQITQNRSRLVFTSSSNILRHKWWSLGNKHRTHSSDMIREDEHGSSQQFPRSSRHHIHGRTSGDFGKQRVSQTLTFVLVTIGNHEGCPPLDRSGAPFIVHIEPASRVVWFCWKACSVLLGILCQKLRNTFRIIEASAGCKCCESFVCKDAKAHKSVGLWRQSFGNFRILCVLSHWLRPTEAIFIQDPESPQSFAPAAVDGPMARLCHLPVWIPGIPCSRPACNICHIL